MLTTKTLLGASWATSARLISRLIDFMTILLLARILTPADFGFTAIATSLVAIVDMVLEVPLILALISLDRVTKAHLNTAFTLAVLRGLVFSAIILGAAWPFSYIYNDPRLIPVLAALAVGPIARGFLNPRMSEFSRAMSFRPSFIADLSGKLLASSAALCVVFLGGGYWAIVTASVVSPVGTTLASYVLAPFRPRLSLARFSEFSRFLGWFSTTQVTVALSWQYDRMLLGYFVPKADLGQYTMAADMAALPTQSLIGPAMQPLLAAFTKVGVESGKLQSAYLRASQFTLMLAAPTCIGMSLTSDVIVDVLLGAKWREAAFYLQWLALAAVFNAFYQPMHALALSLNRTDLVFRISLAELCIRIVLMPIGLYYYSITGIVAVQLAVSLTKFGLSIFAARSLVKASALSQLANLWKVAAACAAMAAFVMLARSVLAGTGAGSLASLMVAATSGAVVYACALLALGFRPGRYIKRDMLSGGAA
ncbi:MAG TPA: lipopolysaccharide biosynthesis protein [Bradyrhizobium sp.]|nr:lipopolysaccharide biosynthesis protein [Bradyrhizobium sp.]